MFTLYMKWDAGCDLAPADIQFILTPRDALKWRAYFMNWITWNMNRVPVINISPSQATERRLVGYMNQMLVVPCMTTIFVK